MVRQPRSSKINRLAIAKTTSLRSIDGLRCLSTARSTSSARSTYIATPGGRLSRWLSTTVPLEPLTSFCWVDDSGSGDSDFGNEAAVPRARLLHLNRIRCGDDADDSAELDSSDDVDSFDDISLL